MKWITTTVAALVLAWLPTAVPAADSVEEKIEAALLMQRVKAALEPPRDNVRTLEITIIGPRQVESKWRAFEARQHRDRRSRLALVVTEPLPLRGIALLFDEKADAAGVEHHYLPVTRRVRKLAPIGRFQPFLGSDFTYADIGLLPLRNRRFEVGAPSVIDGTAVHQVVEYPQPNFYYGKVVNWISTKGLLPVRRDFYAPSDLLWKRQYFEEVVEIDDIPTPTRVRMVDELAGESSIIDTKEVRFTTVPDDVFEPDRLPTLIDHPIWNR